MRTNMEYQISVRGVEKLAKGEYRLVDIRDEISFQHGHLPGAVNVPAKEWEELLENEIMQNEDFQPTVDKENLPETAAGQLLSGLLPGQKLVLYCRIGEASDTLAERLREKKYEAYSMNGGYQKWLLHKVKTEDVSYDIEKSLQKKFRKNIWCQFTKAINRYQLVQEGDKIAVCISGGKDSMLMAKLFQELKRHNKFQFELVFLVMDPGYNKANRELIEANAKKMKIPVTIFESDIFESVFEIEKSPCYLCARMRRGHLYSQAKKLGCNKIALGHHYDDVIETILMGMLYGGQVQTMMPKLHSTNFEGMELIRPMYLIREEDIKAWRDYNDLHFLQCACKFTETCTTCSSTGDNGSKRQETKQIIRKLKELNPHVEANIFKSVENVSLNTVIAYKENGIKHHFLDDYDNIK